MNKIMGSLNSLAAVFCVNSIIEIKNQPYTQPAQVAIKVFFISFLGFMLFSSVKAIIKAIKADE